MDPSRDCLQRIGPPLAGESSGGDAVFQAPLLEMGASAIKTDFGEEIDETAEYCAMPAEDKSNRSGSPPTSDKEENSVN